MKVKFGGQDKIRCTCFILQYVELLSQIRSQILSSLTEGVQSLYGLQDPPDR